MKRSLFIGMLMLALVPAAQAQSSAGDGEAYVPQVARDAPRTTSASGPEESVGPENESFSLQDADVFLGFPGADQLLGGHPAGSGNRASVTQSGNNNVAAVTQRGAGNVANLQQLGNGNEATLLQDGNNNFYDAVLEGNDNTTNALQMGNNNRYGLDFQSNNLDHSIEQFGNDNTLIQVGVGRQPFSVRQEGNRMELMIQHNQ